MESGACEVSLDLDSTWANLSLIQLSLVTFRGEDRRPKFFNMDTTKKHLNRLPFPLDFLINILLESIHYSAVLTQRLCRSSDHF